MFSERQKSRWQQAGLFLCVLVPGGCATAIASDDATAVAVTQATLSRCLDKIATEASRQGVPKTVFSRYTGKLKPDPGVIEKLNFQPEFISSASAYLKAAVSEQRVTTGRTMMTRHAHILNKLQAKYGVPKEVLVAVWGIESNYGQNFGKRPVLRSLATLACHGRRQAFFRKELIATLQIVDAGHVNPDKLLGSWAGAFGHTQFMPTTFLSRAIDHDGDGRRDLVENLGDALASTANYLKTSGWKKELPWGVEVAAPPSVKANSDTRKQKKSLKAWRRAGVRGLGSDSIRLLDTLPTSTEAALIRPSDYGGPLLLVFGNFDAIHAYNPSVKYSLAVSHLADRLARKQGFVTPWPNIGKPLTRDERRELQALLLAQGHRIGKIDGILGARSRAAIRKERARLSNPGTAGYRPVLDALRQRPS